jgi:hypothetical protein
MNRDLASSATTVVAIESQDAGAGATVDGPGIDCRDFRWAYVIANFGDGTGASGSSTVTIEESDDDGATDAYAAVTGATFTVTADTQGVFVGQVDTHSTKRYLRVSVVAAATAATQIGASMVLTADRDTQYGTPTAASFSV